MTENEFIKPLTLKMIDLLMECHEREILRQPPLDAFYPFSKGLIRRNLVTVDPYITENGKKIMSIFLNDKGRHYLKLNCSVFSSVDLKCKDMV